MTLQPLAHAKTLAELLLERLTCGGETLALHVSHTDGSAATRTWNELRDDVAAMIAVLQDLNVAPGACVAQLSENRYEWLLVDFACLLLQAVHVPLHASLSGWQAVEQITHSGALLVFVSTAAQADKLAQVKERWPTGVQFISHEPCSGLLGDAWQGQTDQLLRGTAGERALAAFPPLRTIDESTLATILYTSGTTGQPKGVMLTHGNLCSNAVAATMAFGPQADEVRLGFLPLSHIFARTCDLYSWLVRGSELVLSAGRDHVLAECARFQPTVLNGVPYFFEKIYRSLCEKQVHETPGILQKVLGGRIRYCNSGGAALPLHVFDYYHAQGVPLLEGYGLSETSPVITLSTPDAFKRGSCGQPVTGVEVSIAADQEILTRGPHVMHGYYQMPEATQDVLASGWLKTGDLGYLDSDGFLFITGRKKELIVLSSGKNIAPVYLEGLLMRNPAIAQAMVVGDGHSYLVALIVPRDLADAGADAAIVARYQRMVDDALAECSHHEQIRRITLLPEPFSIERDEMTPKLSLRRPVIAQHYAAEIDAMYAADQTECD